MTGLPAFIASTTPQSVAGWLSSSEFHLLDVVCNTFLPSLEPPPGCSASLAAYYRRSASDMHIAMHIAEMLAGESAEKRAQLHQLLAFLASPLSGLLLIGRPVPFSELPLVQREKYLLAMANSPLGLLRQGYQVLKRLAGFVFFAALDTQGHNPNWEVMDYTLPASLPLHKQHSITPLTIQKDTMLTCDVVVVGSGAGGGVVAGELAMAGKDVVVLEMGGYYSEADYPLQESRAMPALYLKRGLLASKDLGVLVLAGSALGGGTVVNWTTSFRTPAPILDEWSHLSGLSDFTESELQDSFKAVEQRIQVNSQNSAHNLQNQKLFDGCRALGYHADSLRRNAVGCSQRCGSCGFGCRYGCKQSTLKTYLQDAYDHGARIITCCRADKVLMSNGRATGVRATVTDAQTGKTCTLTVHAKAVIVAAGAVCSPALLLQSGLANPHIGRHLKLHPVAIVGGVYADKVYPWEGVIQSAYSDEFGYLNGNYGYKLEVPSTHPGLLALALPWMAARDFRDQMTRAAHLATFIVLVRDRGEGMVTVDRAGQPVINYVTSVFDRRHLMHGMQQAARIHMAAGATEVSTIQSRRTQLLCPAGGSVSERQWHAFDRQVERHGLGVNRLLIFSAHQMGTCRMGANPLQSVLDRHCQVHGVRGLFVCDGSVFPSASGVNPMLTIMALAHRAAQYIKTIL